MRHSGTGLFLLIILLLAAIALAAGPLAFSTSAAAQAGRGPAAGNQMPGPGRGDMWDPHWMQRQIWGPRDMDSGVRPRMNRHWNFMNQGIDEEYMRAQNPFDASAGVIASGRELFSAHCASCHGATGLGDGDAGRSLSPSPALLAYLIQMPMTVDSYLLWAISEGGVAFGTPMPSFKATLPKDDIWKIVTFMRAGFPKETAK